MSYLADVGALARKDLKIELRAKETLPSMLLFVLAACVRCAQRDVKDRPLLGAIDLLPSKHGVDPRSQS